MELVQPAIRRIDRARLLKLTEDEFALIEHDWEVWARPNQLPPLGDWRYWLVKAGRGFGKTRLGAEWVRKMIRTNRYVNLIGATADNARDIMILGESGIMAVCPKDERPIYLKGERKLKWPNGALSLVFTAQEPERMRGPQHEKLWCDELASWNYPQEAWDQAMFGLRLGKNPQALVTSTPRPIPIVRELLKDPATVVTNGTTYENQANLAPSFFSQIIRKYEGTRLGRQELNAELLEDNPNALWMRARIDQLRVKLAPPLKRIVVAIDVAVTSGESSSHTGIVVAGIGEDNHGYILADLSIQASPDEWGQIAVDAYRQHQADRIIGEVNNGGDLVESLLRTIDRNISYKAVRASRGKTTRAEPIAALYEQGRVHHVGCLPQLEDEMVNYDPSPDSKQDSPDRMDALVWALHELFIEEPAEGGNVFSSPWRQWKADDLPKCAQIIQSVATEVAEENVQWAVTTWGVFIPLHSLPRVNVKIEPQDKKPSVILLAHEGATGSMEQAVKGIRQQYEKYKPDFLVVASQPGTKPVVRHLWRERLNVKRLKYDDAAGPQIGAEMLSAGMAWAPKKEWAKHVAQEVARYPYAERKVTVHSVALALVWLRHMGDVHPVFDPDEPPPPKSPEQYKPVYG